MRLHKTISTVSNTPHSSKLELDRIRQKMNVSIKTKDRLVQSLPFAFRDTTAGTENEFQAVVLGKKENIDLAITIEESNYYKNILRRTASGDMSRKKVVGLEKYLDEKRNRIWENSWVRFPRKSLHTFANHIFRSDLKSDKTDPTSPNRKDAARYVFKKDGDEYVRIPVSYLLKLSLADLVGQGASLHPMIRIMGEKMMGHFSNDNTSPEIVSFHPVRAMSSFGSVGTEIAKETLIRFLFTQLLLSYAEQQFKLEENGQQVRVFFSASPPIMQKQLNDCISDEFYRYLFMSPCLSGWSKGQEKYEYMKLCHKVLSRSQINGISKLKEAGIINSNLVVLPNSSNISLANNGTHISMGSKKLGELLKDQQSGFTSIHEKYLGDLAIKIKEHFLALFPGTYSASPYRLNFEDFHPETALGFLPHEIDYTHLRMIWRRWKRKAKISILGNPVTPFGPVWVDRLIRRCFFLKGDYLPDYRLVDYFVSLMSTDESPSLNGQLGNGEQLKKDLSHMGIFDETMPLYQLVRLREYSQMGYSGFEHRYYSIFENIMSDMGQAADFQNLITALAYQYILSGEITHDMIPDTPDIESERRQIFFCSAINLPTFFVKTKTSNLFLKKILKKVKKTRHSHRYKGYTRIRMADYKKALIEVIKSDGKELIQGLKLKGLLSDLEARVSYPKVNAASGKLVSGILGKDNQKEPMTHNGSVFNRKAEQFYIDGLRTKQIMEGFSELENEFKELDLWAAYRDPACKEAILKILGPTGDLLSFIQQVKKDVKKQTLSHENLRKLLFLMVVYVNKKNREYSI